MRVISRLEDLADEAAAGTELRRYLECRGIRTVPTLALMASSETELAQTLIEPLLAGWKINDSDYIRLPVDEQPIARAIITHMWMLARQSWQASMATPVAVATPPPASGTPTATTPAVDKIPKTLPAGVWMSLVKSYNAIQLNGRDRDFPVAELLGSECVVARMWHEHNVSKLYTPVGLGEIIQRRSFTASGDVNPLAKSSKKSASLSLDEENQLIQADDPEWSPKSLLAIIDGVTAAKWAMILTQWGEEHLVQEYTNWMIQRARSRPAKIEQFLTYWTSASWTLAMALRTGKTFAEASSAVMADLDKFTEHMAKEPVNPKTKQPVVEDPKGKGKWGPGRNKGSKGDKNKGPSRYASYGKSDRWYQDSGSHWHGAPYWQRAGNPNRQGSHQDSWSWDKNPPK